MEIRRMGKVAAIAAAGLLGVVLIVLMGRDPDHPPGDTPRGENLPQGQRPPRMTGAETARPRDITALGTSENTVIQRANPETGELEQEFFYGTLTPRDQGVFEITRPRARLYLEPWRVIHLRSDKGRFIAPGRQPRSGEFRDNVVITIYQSGPGEPLDLSADSRDRMVRIELDQARFDRTIGEITSTSDVRVTTPVSGRVSFRGRGLKLLYNDRESRIESLEILHGESLRYVPPKDGGGLTAAKDEQQDGGAGDTAGAVDGSAGGPAGADRATAPADGPPTYYRAVFEDAVHVEREGRTIDANRLTAFLPMDAADEPAASKTSRDREGAVPEPSAGAASPSSGGLNRSETRTPAPAPSGAPDQSAPEAAPDDRDTVTMTWTGPMVMKPAASTPAPLRGADDLYLRFDGSPVAVASPGDQTRLLCDQLDYLESRRLITATGNGDHPLRARSPALGVLRGERLLVQAGRSTAQLVGPGSIRAPDRRQTDGRAEAEAARALPPGFAIRWSEGVDLAFASPKPAPAPAPVDPEEGESSAAGSSRGAVAAASTPRPDTGLGGGIESATFRGDVRVADPRFTLTADRLTPRFTAAGEGSERRLRSLDAAGRVRVETDRGDIRATRLRIETSANEAGERTPSRLIADGDVRLIEPDRRLAADHLDATLGPAEDGKQPPAVSIASQNMSEKPRALTSRDREGAGGLGGPGPLPHGRGSGSASPTRSQEPAEAQRGEPPAPAATNASSASAPVGGGSPAPVAAAPLAPRAAPAPPQEAAASVEVRRVIADGSVELTLADGAAAHGDRLEADAQAETAVLTGSPVRVTRGGDPEANVRPESELHVPRLHVEQRGRVVWAEGGGEFLYTQPPSAPGGARDRTKDAPARAPDGSKDSQDSPRRVAVAWTRRMRFDRERNTIRVEGNAEAISVESPAAVNRVTAARMTLELRESPAEADASPPAVGSRTASAAPPPQDARPGRPAPANAERNPNPPAESGRSSDADRPGGLGTGGLKRLIAEGDVILLATQWREPGRENVRTRLRLEGDTLTFDNAAQTARIRGAGRMLIEDYRETSTRASSSEAADAGTVFTGGGATLFTWSDGFTWNNAETDLSLTGAVRMTHQPARREGTLEMRADRLTADLNRSESFRAVGMTGSEGGGSADIRRIRADGGVQVRDGDRLISADRLRYRGDARTVLLTAEPPGRVRVARLDRPKPLLARSIRWNLKTGGFEVLDAGL